MAVVKAFDPYSYHHNVGQIIIDTIYNNDYILHKPYSRQAEPLFEVNKLMVDNEPNQILVGAGGYGGKTYLGTMLAGQFLNEPDYSCLVTRLNYAELTGEDSIWENACDWFCDEERLGDSVCKSNDHKIRIKAPSGATIWFKAFDQIKKKQKVKSESYDRIVNDEASELAVGILTFLYRSLRNPKDSPIQLAMINLSNPGGPATEYLLEKYVDGYFPYYPLDWRHNPYIDPVVYSKTLDNLDYIDQQYQKYGNWRYKPAKGDLFKEKDLRDIVIDSIPQRKLTRCIRGIDMAITKRGDRSAFLKWIKDSRGHAYIADLKLEKTKYPENILIDCVEEDNPNWDQGVFETEYVFEYEGGSAAVHQERFINSVLADYIEYGLTVYFVRHTVNKFTRARAMARAIQNLNVSILKADWNEDLIEEFKNFGPDDKEYDYDDIVDAGSIGYNKLFEIPPQKAKVYV